MKLHIILYIVLLPMFLLSCKVQSSKQTQVNMKKESTKNKYYSTKDTGKLILPEAEWKNILSQEQYFIARQKGTERPFNSHYENFSDNGTYHCIACGNALFVSNTKFESGCGWPSFFKPVKKSSVIYIPDTTHGMQRTEVQCGRCNAHLGHVFDDGPPPTGLRYCINGAILEFEKRKTD